MGWDGLPKGIEGDGDSDWGAYFVRRRRGGRICIAPQAQGQGYATVATRLAIDYAFSVLNLRKIDLIVDKSNAAAIHVYEKCGFRHEAELIEEFFGNGQDHNALRMCMFQHEFFAASLRGD